MYKHWQRPVLALIFALFTPSLVLAARPGDAGQVKFQGAAFPIAEEAGQVTITVKRLSGETGAVSVAYETLPGTAEAGVDYEAVSGTLQWADGDGANKTFIVPILDDTLNEGLELFGLRLFDATGGLDIGSPSIASVHIKPSDRSGGGGGGGGGGGTQAGTIKLTSTSFPAFESALQAEVTVERAGGGVGQVSVDYFTIAGSATAGVDFTLVNGTLTWAAGEQGIKTILVPILDDAESEGLETITVGLTNPQGGASLGVRDVGSVVIVDDDGSSGSCIPDETTLCLRDGRFQVVGTWQDFIGNSGPFHWVPATGESGLAWFFNEANVEFLIKVLDGCPINGHFWVFYAATTNVGFEIEVTDLQTGATKTYTNPLGVVSLAITDITAFPSCGS